MPGHAAEWMIAAVGSAELSVRFGDRDAAGVLYEQLLPFAGLQAIGLACGPDEGPVTLSLGRLALLLGRNEDAQRHLKAAVSSCEDQQALPYLAEVHATLAGSFGASTQAGREHVEIASRIARRLGLRPLLATLADRGRTDEPLVRLTSRELEIAGLVADGMTNAGIAGRLTLSERTVENHVSHILRTLDLPSRSAVASWYTGNARTSGERPG